MVFWIIMLVHQLYCINNKILCSISPFLYCNTKTWKFQITVEAGSSQSHTNPQSSQLWKYTTDNLYFTQITCRCQRPPYTPSCLLVHYFALYAHNFWCEMKNLGQVWKSFIWGEGGISMWCNALQFQIFPSRAFLVTFEASHATCVTYEAYRSNWAKPPPPSSH